TYGGTNWNSSSASGMAQVVSGSWGAVTGTTNYAAYWSDENTISAEQYLAVTRGGTGAGTFTGVLKGNGTGAFTAMTGTPNYVTRWTDANTLGIGTLYDNGTSVGIGTATPGALFEVYGSSTQFRLYYNANGPLSGYADFSVGSGGNLTIQPTGTSATTTIGTGSTILAVDSTGVKPGTDNNYDLGSADYRFRDLYLGPGSLKMYNSWTDAANYELGKLSFNTNVLTLATSAAGSGTVRSVHITTGANTGLYVISSGNVGIGTTSPGYLLQMEASGGGYYDVTDHSWHNGSSIRFKEDIQPLGGALSTIRQIQGVRYNWKEQYGGAADIGFIAEDLGQVLPEVVSWDPKNPGYANGISYGKITALLLEGVKEIDELLAPLDIDESGNLGLGTTESRARLEARAVSGPQLNLSRDAGNYTEFETGADGNLTVSPSGGKMTVAGQLDASSGGIVTKVVSGEVTDSNFEIDTDGAIAIDSANGRIYFRYGGNWHYADKAGGFQIPNYETAPYEDLPKKARQSKQAALPFEESSFDDYLTQRLMPGDFLIPYVDEYLPDGAAHGLYARFNDVKGKMFKEEQEQLVDLAVKMDKNVTSLGEMQDLVEDNFGILGADLESLKDKVEEVDWLAVSNEEEIAALKGKAAVASVDIDGLKDGLISAEEKIDSVEKKIASLEELVKGKGNETGAELDILTGLIDSFGENGTFSVSGSVALAGKLDAEQVVTSILAIRNESEEIKVIGEEEILPVATDEDGDGYDDANGADGKGVIISTSAISETCKIFISFEDDPGSASWVEKTKIPPETDKYNGFIIRLGEPIKQKTKVSWWIVEKEKNE
ncbi:tail fiber domain-containing protein, partial [Patescibacteria group bacterium]|nr:tail fiber domain-containing protein [Patescibacteria group bacterium]